MSTEIAAASQPYEEPNSRSQRQAEPKRDGSSSRTKPILSRQECLSRIESLNGLVAVKALSPSQANSIRANLQTILREHEREQQGQAAPLSDDTVRQVWKADPRLISLVGHLLTPEQLEMVMREATEE